MNRGIVNYIYKSYLLFAIITLAISAPVFYYFTDRVYKTDVKDGLWLHYREFVTNRLDNLQPEDIEQWNNFNRDSKIKKDEELTKPRFITTQYYDELDQAIEPYLELHAPLTINGHSYTYSERANLVESRDFLLQMVILFFVLILIQLVGLFLITSKYSRFLQKSLRRMLYHLKNFEINKGVTPAFEVTHIQELDEISQGMKYRMQKNLDIFNSQREFIENAAHELQTPLAIFQAKVELLSQDSTLNYSQLQIISSVNEGITRLHRLNKNLLLLSKMDHRIYSNKQMVDIQSVIETNWNFFKEQSLSKNLSLRVDLHSVSVHANLVLVEILMRNLFMNTIRHNHENGLIHIYMKEQQIIFANTGKPESLDQDKVFTRFFQNDKSKNGTGLGLAIIKKIVDLNGWTIHYRFEQGMHQFIVDILPDNPRIW